MLPPDNWPAGVRNPGARIEYSSITAVADSRAARQEDDAAGQNSDDGQVSSDILRADLLGERVNAGLELRRGQQSLHSRCFLLYVVVCL